MPCAHAQNNILHIKHAEKTNDYGSGICIGVAFGLEKVQKLRSKTKTNIFQRLFFNVQYFSVVIFQCPIFFTQWRPLRFNGQRLV